ncbi:Ribonuclease 3 [Hypsibius exemplaris]|uniref:Ribonuclease 3 n=1 Tax=Hypsibius exemplaris TaxID=2072580 RepID=A0A1W0WD77_HYPEX|nr:Ribonuclease 3 [Hypsibius exemplaris]
MAWPQLPYVFLDTKEYYEKGEDGVVSARTLLRDLHRNFRARVLDVFDAANTKREDEELSSDSSEESDDEADAKAKSTLRTKNTVAAEKKDPKGRDVRPKKDDPRALDKDLSFNEKNMLNDGKACRCKKVLRGYGTKHGHLVGDDQQKYTCEPRSNNAKSLFCYRINLDPTVNFDSALPSTIFHNGKQCAFLGFCLLAHQKLDKYPMAQTTRFNASYNAILESIPVPGNFVLGDLNLLKKFVFSDILELKDWRLKAESLAADSKYCDTLHFLPIFGRTVDTVVEVAPMSSVLDHIMREFRFLFSEEDSQWLKTTSQSRFEDHVQRFRGALVARPGQKPAALRVDQIDRDTRDITSVDRKDRDYPAIVHFTTRCSNTSDQNYFKAQRKLENMHTAIENKPKDQVTPEEKMRCREQEKVVEDMRSRLSVKRDVTVVLSSREFYHTGLRSDVAQYCLLIPWIALHYRFHISLDVLEQKLGYSFHDRNLLELALTHPSYRTNLGTNPDHIRNSQTNLGIRKVALGQAGTAVPKSGMKTLIHTMAQLGAEDEMASPIKNYERLEFLGDAVLEFITSIRLFLMFPHFQEGGLATFRSTLVQNNHLALLAETYNLSHFLLLSHGREMNSRTKITDRHATANCFEAICGAIYLDSGIKFVDEFISRSLGTRLFCGDEALEKAWRYPPAHISEVEYPEGDRHLIPQHELLQRVIGFEEQTGIFFRHVRLLANAFSSRQVHENPITIGNNQRLEFLGDTVLQLIVSDYLFKHFPSHHEGHLSLLRSSLVSNETQALVCDELGMRRFLIKEQTNGKDGYGPDIKMKDKADLVEAFLGALYLDKGLMVSEAFCRVVFFPKLTDFIGSQSWSDPKSRLQQCCLTLRNAFEKGSPRLPQYKIINKEGPSNNRRYEVAVYFNGERLASGVGSNTKQAEKVAADAALKNPIFLPDFQRQQDFAKRAVAAQKHHQSRIHNTNGEKRSHDRDRDQTVSSVVPYRRQDSRFQGDRRDSPAALSVAPPQHVVRDHSLSRPADRADRCPAAAHNGQHHNSREDSRASIPSTSQRPSQPTGSNPGQVRHERRDRPAALSAPYRDRPSGAVRGSSTHQSTPDQRRVSNGTNDPLPQPNNGIPKKPRVSKFSPAVPLPSMNDNSSIPPFPRLSHSDHPRPPPPPPFPLSKNPPPPGGKRFQPTPPPLSGAF